MGQNSVKLMVPDSQYCRMYLLMLLEHQKAQWIYLTTLILPRGVDNINMNNIE